MKNKELIAWIEKRLDKSLAMDRDIYSDLVILLKKLKSEA
jgi:hypothetical protein